MIKIKISLTSKLGTMWNLWTPGPIGKSDKAAKSTQGARFLLSANKHKRSGFKFFVFFFSDEQEEFIQKEGNQRGFNQFMQAWTSFKYYKSS